LRLKLSCVLPVFLWIFFSLVALGGSLSFASSPELESGPSFIRRGWQVDEGLPHNVVRRIVQSGDGYLWLATGEGLTRFDGVNFNLYNLPDRSAERAGSIRDICLETPDTLLFLPASGGLYQCSHGKVTEHPASAALRQFSLVDVYAEESGVVWVGTENDTVIRWEKGVMQTFGAESGIIRRGNRFCFVRDKSGKLWIAGGDFIGVYSEGRLIRESGVEGSSFIIAPTRDGGLWISTFKNLYKLEGDQLITVLTSPRWPVTRSSVSHLFEDSRGALWISTRRDGLFRLADDRVTSPPTANPLISCVMEDREKNIWVSMEGGGIDRLQRKAYTLIDRRSGMHEDVSISLCSDRHGVLWCANRNGGIVRIADGKAESIARSIDTTEYFAICVCPDQQDHIWAGTPNGVDLVDTAPPYDVRKMDFPLMPVRALFCAKNGDMWVGAGDGALGYFRDGKYVGVRQDQHDSRSRVCAIAESPDGAIWIGTRGGEILFFTGNAFTKAWPLTATDPLRPINSFCVDHSGVLWAATSQGIVQLTRGTTRVFTREDGLPDDNIDQILEDGEGRLWLGGRLGIAAIDENSLRNVALDKTAKLAATTFGRDEGMAGMSTVNGDQPLSWRTDDGRLWFSTHRGLVGIDPHVLSRARPAPPVYIDEISIDGKAVSVPAQGLTIPSRSQQVSFRFVALNFSAPEKARVRHQLIGVDPTPIETKGQHLAVYSQIPPGKYQMRVAACNQDGVWNDAGDRLGIVVLAAWWQSLWFGLITVVAATGLIVWIARYVSHRRLKTKLRQLEYENSIERERARIARDLHDDFGGNITQIRLLAERIKRHAESLEFKNAAGLLASRARQLSGELESIIWTVSPKNTTWNRLADFIRQYAMKFFRDTGITCIVQQKEDIPAAPLRPEEQHNLLAIAKEAMNNALKHSHATQAEISFGQQAGKILIEIRDNGVGFDPTDAQLTTSNGLNNMRNRAKEIGAELTIESRPTEGTRIRVAHAVTVAHHPAL